MSQYPPSPYMTPNVYPAGYGFDPMGAYLAQPRRTSVLMFVMGGLGLACGVCMGLVGAFAPVATILQRGGMNLEQFGDVGMPPEQFFRVLYIVMGSMILIGSLILIVLGVFVRRGSMAAAVTSIVFCSLAGLLLLLNVVTGLIQALRQPRAESVMGLILVAIPFAAFALLLVWLIQSARAASALKAARTQYQMQYWQYQQQQQMYAQQAGHGYAQAPPDTNKG